MRSICLLKIKQQLEESNGIWFYLFISFFFLVFSALDIFLVLGQNSQEKPLKEGEIVWLAASGAQCTRWGRHGSSVHSGRNGSWQLLTSWWIRTQRIEPDVGLNSDAPRACVY